MAAIAQLMPTRFSKGPAPKFLGFKSSVGDFHDCFAGTGSSFLYLADGFTGDRKIYVSDSNPDLINLWNCIKYEPINLVRDLCKYKGQEANNRSFFEESRRLFNHPEEPQTNCERAALMLYLVQGSFNSLWRVNSDGEFNVNIGNKKTIILPTENDLIGLADFLKNAVIKHQSFEESLQAVKPNDVVYLDPPYIEVSKTSFTKYTTKGFSKDQQILLRQEADRLHALGAHVVASNSDTPLSRELWSGWEVAEITRSGCMNCDATKRQRVGELVFYKK